MFGLAMRKCVLSLVSGSNQRSPLACILCCFLPCAQSLPCVFSRWRHLTQNSPAQLQATAGSQKAPAPRQERGKYVDVRIRMNSWRQIKMGALLGEGHEWSCAFAKWSQVCLCSLISHAMSQWALQVPKIYGYWPSLWFRLEQGFSWQVSLDLFSPLLS